MPKLTPQHELDQLVSLIAQEPKGMGADALQLALGGSLQRRTLQRRLALLVAQQRIQTQGESRAMRYVVPQVNLGTAVLQAPSPGLQFTAEAYVPTSPEGEEIKAYVRQPRHLRQPVSYKLGFLEQYHPNQTAYLPQSLRDQLHALGRSPAEQTPAGTFARDILNRLLIDLSWASSQLEGNTYSRLDTERLIEFGQAADGKDALETQMILNHKEAINYLVRDTENAVLSTDTLFALHALLSDGLLADAGASGRIRHRAVEIGGSVYMPVALPQRLEELFGIVIQMATEIADPFEQAFFLMVHLPYLQPFEDVNKRVSRLAANIPFIHHNLCPLSFIDVPQQAYVDALIGVYELNRIELLRDVFVWAYERSCQQYVAVKQTLVPPDIFRLRHRQALSLVIANIVRNGAPVTPETVRAQLPSSVANADAEAFVTLVLSEFKSLHPGNAVRFGIRPLEFETWQKLHTQHS
ncbi:MAG TPA: Fic family protein [Rhodoferax sp.]